MSYVTLDVETTIKNKGNPYTRGNRLCYIGMKENKSKTSILVPEDKVKIKRYWDRATCLIGFNLKFDLAWMLNAGYEPWEKTVWDCQLAEFIISRQTRAYPSLNDALARYHLPQKEDKVKRFWGMGIDTPQIPKGIVYEYLGYDVEGTFQVFLNQWRYFKEHPLEYELFKLQCEDLLTLLDMEYNGINFDVEQAKRNAAEYAKEIQEITHQLMDGYWGIPINFNSIDHLSAYLYGGSISHINRIPIGVYNTGERTGQPRYRLEEVKYDLPRLVEPLPKSKLKKEGLYRCDEPTLRSLKGNAEFRKRRDLLFKLAKIDKMKGTYFDGLANRIEELDFFDGKLHGQFNQVVARTGRLSSSKPNLQNNPPEAKKLMRTDYL